MWMTVFYLGLMLPAPAPVATSLPEEIAVAIQRYQRPWQPEAGALAGLTVSIRPTANDSADKTARVAHDTAILTTGYVEQLVKRGGGGIASPSVRPADSVGLTVAYRAAATNAVAVACETTGKNTLILASTLARAWGQDVPAERTSDDTASETHGSVAADCAVEIPFDSRESFTKEDLRRRARDDATKIVHCLVDYRSRVIAIKAPTANEVSERLRRVVTQLCPEPTLPLERTDWFCRMFAKVAVSNASLTLFQPQATLEGETVVVGGRTTAPSAVRGLMTALRLVGLKQLRNEMRVLPDEQRLGDQRFGACVATAIITRQQPNESSGEQTELLYGEPVYLLDQEKNYYLLLAGDGYWGWAPRETILPMTEAAFAEYLKHPRGVVSQAIELDTAQILRGALVAIEPANAGNVVSVILPDGSRKSVPASKVRDTNTEKARAARRRVRAALDSLYVPYKWGGRSPLGTDCSGLVGEAYIMSGVTPARDAWQLAFFGQLSATRWYRADLRAGDIVFFIDDRGTIYHAGIAIDATHIVDASPPAVQIGSIVPGDRLYDKRMDRDFFIAKRP